ncbi:STAS domain-containing protein [Candidatus Dependentiae bacterium]|nr:STAS domain-containing protein [Candidatus Dependentiae bacterium]
MEIIEYRNGDILVMSLTGKLNSLTADYFEKKLMDHLASGSKKIIIDLKKLDFLSSRGIRIFYKAYEFIQKSNDCRIVFSEVNSDIKKVFELVELENDFPVYPEVDSAIKNGFN